jgi:hypothetical protein
MTSVGAKSPLLDSWVLGSGNALRACYRQLKNCQKPTFENSGHAADRRHKQLSN